MKCGRRLYTRFLAEFTGTAMLMTIGCMGNLLRTPVEVGINFGFAWLACIQAFGFICGAHINPAVTLANLLLDLMPCDMAAVYFLLQLTGALLGFFILSLLTSSDAMYAGKGLCVTLPHSALSDLQAVGMEFVLTATLILFYCSIWDKRNVGRADDSLPLSVGLLVSMLHLTGGSFTTPSLNFARTLAPAIWQNRYDELWIYFVGQMLAAITVPYAWMFLFTGDGRSNRRRR